LNKAHVRYLEARLISLARDANQWEIDNHASPTIPPLSEADRADAEWFLNEMLVIYPILGVDAFESASEDVVAKDAGQELQLRGRGADARGREVKDGFVVLEDSHARATETKSIHAFLSDLRKQLLERGVLVPAGNRLRFTQDFRFASPSTAAGILVGGAANGRKAWKTSDGKQTLKQIQDARTEKAGM